MAHPQRRYRREARYSKQLRVTVQPATAAALEAEADAAGVSVSAVIRDAVARGLPLARDARRKRRSGPRTPAARGRRDELAGPGSGAVIPLAGRRIAAARASVAPLCRVLLMETRAAALRKANAARKR